MYNQILMHQQPIQRLSRLSFRVTKYILSCCLCLVIVMWYASYIVQFHLSDQVMSAPSKAFAYLSENEKVFDDILLVMFSFGT